MIRWPSKSPGEVEDFEFDWTSALVEGETIDTRVVTATGVTKVSDAIEGSFVRVWLAGGTEGTTARVTCTITTSGGRTYQETALLLIGEEPVSLSEIKQYLGLYDSDRDGELSDMIVRARRKVEEYTGLLLVRQQKVEEQFARYGYVRLNWGPLVSVDGIAYTDTAGADQTYEARWTAGSSVVRAALGGSWPSSYPGDGFVITYTAGYASGEVEPALLGGMKALIEGEFSEGYAWPQRSVEAMERCCDSFRTLAV